MSDGPRTAREVFASVLGDHMTAKVWTSNYAAVLPFTPQSFAVGALLPMMLYLFRWGHRRGRGKFRVAFSAPGGRPTIRSVSARLAADPRLEGFESELGKTLLGDMLLTAALENRRRAEGHEEQVQRCFATHYLASWIDLPFEAANLRGVPESIVALIADQRSGDVLASEAAATRYRVGARIQDNEFIAAFALGVRVEGGRRMDLRSDEFDEAAPVGLDQLLTIRLAQLCGEAPGKASGKGEPGPIPNQRPIAARAAKAFREDLLVFFDCYGRNGVVPRLSLLPMLESALAIGLTTILLSTIGVLNSWWTDGVLPLPEQQRPWPVFVDCAGSADPALRDFSEQSIDAARQQLANVSLLLMYMRLLDFFVTTESDVAPKDLPARAPDASAWLNLLGAFASGSHDEARDAERFFRGKCRALADALAAEDPADPRIAILSDEDHRQRHGMRLADVILSSLEVTGARNKLADFLQSVLMTDDPNGLARRRRVARRTPTASGRKTADATSFVLTNTVLEYLVHRHLRSNGRGRKERALSLPMFLETLRDRYGFYIDRSPPNMEVPNAVLQRNRRVLERRLRDLGLLVGVNDAERMKRLKARYQAAYDALPQGADDP